MAHPGVGLAPTRPDLRIDQEAVRALRRTRTGWRLALADRLGIEGHRHLGLLGVQGVREDVLAYVVVKETWAAAFIADANLSSGRSYVKRQVGFVGR